MFGFRYFLQVETARFVKMKGGDLLALNASDVPGSAVQNALKSAPCMYGYAFGFGRLHLPIMSRHLFPAFQAGQMHFFT